MKVKVIKTCLVKGELQLKGTVSDFGEKINNDLLAMRRVVVFTKEMEEAEKLEAEKAKVKKESK